MKFIDENHEAARPQLSPQFQLNHSSIPSREPSSQPSNQPSSKPSSEPSSQPSSKPSSEPSLEPSSKPSSQPSSQPSNLPSSVPSSVPSRSPSSQPSSQPSESPSSQPSESPSSQPSSQPSESPSSQPSSQPSESPSSQPSESPSSQPSSEPSESPSSQPSESPSEYPSAEPSETPSSNPSRSCENLRTDCGWGIFNPWTCQCDCAVGICLDNNQQCYTRCDETIKSNPWGGCSPGWDCPWYPDDSLGYCRSEMALVEKYDLYRTSMACCEKHFPLSSSCNADSIASRPHFPNTPGEAWPLPPPGHPGVRKYFPDLQNKQNCVRGKNYDLWMSQDGFADYYLFDNASDCCKLWYPSRSDCPDSQSAVTPNIEDEAWLSNPYPFANYYFPDFDAGSCGYGKNYPAWMAQDGYARWYLFRGGAECCSKYFPQASNCPYETTPQDGYYWESYQPNQPNDAILPPIYNHTFYPDLEANTCVNGTDYPSWMIANDEFKRLYIFHEPQGCCEFWFGESGPTSRCVGNIIQSVYVNITAGTNITALLLAKWYPMLEESRCINNGEMPQWMLSDGFAEWYLFNTLEACCKAFGYC
ncbi:hypothetical protein HJC23_000004 [Cyclotella cryptica]|uniref:Circumsporozoite protein n=1 Tax=Cyclotella cryptica TaxID=29204 RepID=A0ABD3P3N2_9STRA